MSHQDTYNLSLILQNSVNADCLTPTAFIASNQYKTIYKELTGKSEPSFNIYKHHASNNYYTRCKWLFIAYSRYCFASHNEVCEVVA